MATLQGGDMADSRIKPKLLGTLDTDSDLACQSYVHIYPTCRDQVRAAIRASHYSIRTEQAYVPWVKRFVLFPAKKISTDPGTNELLNTYGDNLICVRHRYGAENNRM